MKAWNWGGWGVCDEHAPLDESPLRVDDGLDPRPEPGAGLGQHGLVHLGHHLLDG